MTTRSIGDIGEKAVCRYLKIRGYSILERNYWIKGGEIDIIAKKRGVIHFVEVKTRKENSLTTGEQAITYTKKQRIIKTAKYYCSVNNVNGYAFSFDVAVVIHKNEKVSDIVYYKDAFSL